MERKLESLERRIARLDGESLSINAHNSPLCTDSRNTFGVVRHQHKQRLVCLSKAFLNINRFF